MTNEGTSGKIQEKGPLKPEKPNYTDRSKSEAERKTTKTNSQIDLKEGSKPNLEHKPAGRKEIREKKKKKKKKKKNSNRRERECGNRTSTPKKNTKKEKMNGVKGSPFLGILR